MTTATKALWESKRTDETRTIEDVLRKEGFAQVDAYRYNLASIRVRVIDPRFETLSAEKRDSMVEPILERLPEHTQRDILSLFTFAPSELQKGVKFRDFGLNREFEDPSPSIL